MQEKTTKRKMIKLTPATAKRLDKIKHKGQSYDGIISELIDHYDKREEGSK